MAQRRSTDYKDPDPNTPKHQEDEYDRAQQSIDRGRVAATMRNQGEQNRKDYIAQQGNAESFARNNPKLEVTTPKSDLPAYKNGTDRVPKDGPAVLHKNEAVLNKDDADKYREAKMATEKKHNVRLYRAMHHLNKGGLHRALGIPEGENIPKERLEQAKNSKNEHIAKMAHFADTMGHFKH